MWPDTMTLDEIIHFYINSPESINGDASVVIKAISEKIDERISDIEQRENTLDDSGYISKDDMIEAEEKIDDLELEIQTLNVEVDECYRDLRLLQDEMDLIKLENENILSRFKPLEKENFELDEENKRLKEKNAELLERIYQEA